MISERDRAKLIAEYWLSKVNAYGESGAISERCDEAIIARAYLLLLEERRETNRAKAIGVGT